MIQSSELRIGNMVKIHGHKGFSKIHTIGIATQCNYVRVNYVDEENNDRISNGYCDELIHGIPLSEEMLLKCGFEKISNVRFTHSELKGYNLSFGKYCYISYVDNGFKYLHQLQNIYFALTGQELNTSGL